MQEPRTLVNTELSFPYNDLGAWAQSQGALGHPICWPCWGGGQRQRAGEVGLISHYKDYFEAPPPPTLWPQGWGSPSQAEIPTGDCPGL